MTKNEFLNIEKEHGICRALYLLCDEVDVLMTYEELKDVISYNVENDNWFLVCHLSDYMRLYKPGDFLLYDCSLGTMDFPFLASCYDDVEHLLDE